MARKQMNLIFPGKGLDRSMPYESQPPYSAPDCQNVRLFDTTEGRARGGSRPGTGRAAYLQMGGGNKINMLHEVTLPDSSGFTQYAENFSLSELSGNGWTAATSYSANLPAIFDPSSAAIVEADEDAKAGAILDTLDPQIDETAGVYTVKMEITPYEGVFGGNYLLFAGLDDTTPDPYQDGIIAQLTMVDGTDSYTGSLKHYSGGVLQNTWAFTPLVSTDLAQTEWLWFHVDGTTIKVYWGAILLTTQTITLGASNHRSGFGIEATIAGAACMVNTYMVEYYTGDAISTIDRPVMMVGCNGILYKEWEDRFVTPISTNLTINNAVRVRCANYQNKLYIADWGDISAEDTNGTVSGTTFDSASYADWTAIGINIYDFVVVISNGSGNTIDGVYEIASIAAGSITLATAPGDGNCEFRIERGPKIYDPLTDTLTLWSASEGGQVPVGCDLIVTYRGRLVLSGNSRLWFMSRQFGPLDFDYGASDVDQSRAVAGQSADAGDIGQTIVSLMPHHDDYLVFGCPRSCWVLRGDPAWSGATLGPISSTVGCVGGDAWTSTDDGALVMLAHSGLYAIAPGGSGFPQLISSALPRELKNLGKSIYQVSVEYEPYDEGIHIFVHQTGVVHTSWWVDWKTRAFFPVKLPVAQIPFCTHAFSGQVQDTTDVRIGCSDGRVRRFADSYTTDDGTAISSFVILGPFKLGNGYAKEGSLEEMVATLGFYSGSVDWSIQVGKASQATILTTTTMDSGTWDEPEGLQLTDRPRVRGESAIVRIANSGIIPWAMEDISIQVETLDDQRML